MASNHTPATAITDALAAEFFWNNGYKRRYKTMTKKNFKLLAETGDLSISSVMENFISIVNPKIKRSNTDGEDHSDGSESKYMSTRIKCSKTKYTNKEGIEKISNSYCLNCSLSPTSLKNKKGTLRIAINVYNPWDKTSKMLLVKIPYPDWSECTVAGGYLNFDFNLDGTFKPIQEKRFGKWVCKNVKEFCA